MNLYKLINLERLFDNLIVAEMKIRILQVTTIDAEIK